MVVLSALDERRVARGELTEAAAEEARRRQTDALSQAGAQDRGDRGNTDAGAGGRARGSNDARLLREVPPHWA
ncbi:transcriptional regulator [Actinomyces oricola]